MMSSPRLLKSWVLIVAPAITLACDDPVQPRPSVSSGPNEQAQLSYDRPDEIHFVQIAQKAPSFGGYFYDEGGDFVAYVRDEGERTTVRGEMERRFKLVGARDRSQRASPRVTFRRGQFTFRQLARWRDLASGESLGRHPLLVYVDMDEARNRVTLGVLPDGGGHDRDELRRRLAEIGIPTAAMHFENTSPIEPLAGASSTPSLKRATVATAAFLDSYATLRDNGSPFIGGLEIQSPACTATLAVDYNSSRHVATASHCTDVIYEVDGEEIFQHDGVSRIGVETQDPLFTLFNGARSRYSDAALALVDAGVETRRGAIARPTGRNGGGWSGGSGPLTINPSRSFFTVTSVENGQVLYAEVQKVGRTTGWTYGIIGATCVDDLGADGAWRRCSTHATFYAQPGDSGSPVFRWGGGDGVTLMGILWGISSSYAAYSGYQSFVRELGGTLNPITDITVSTPSVSGTVNASNLRPELSFSSTTNSPYATEYRVERQRCTYSGGLTSWVQVYQGTSTTFTDYEVTASQTPSSVYPSCGFSGMYWAVYRVTALNMGVYSPGTAEVSFDAYQ